jgi:opacity protein-like surface antigen
MTAVALMATLTVATPARADWLLTPYLGVSFGGSTTGEHLTYGGSLGFMGAGIVGFEIDGSVAPDLLAADGDADFEITGSSATALMGNLIVGAPLGSPGIRPYVSGGGGLLRLSVDTVDEFFDIDDNSFGVNIGAGIMTFFSNNAGIRADVRYFRSLQDVDRGDDITLDLGQLDFWRATVGATFRF